MYGCRFGGRSGKVEIALFPLRQPCCISAFRSLLPSLLRPYPNATAVVSIYCTYVLSEIKINEKARANLCTSGVASLIAWAATPIL